MELHSQFIQAVREIANILIKNCPTALDAETIEHLKSEDNIEV